MKPCGCPDRAVITNAGRHAEWHAALLPLAQADAATLEAAYGRPSIPVRTYIDDQFAAERAKDDLRRQFRGAA